MLRLAGGAGSKGLSFPANRGYGLPSHERHVAKGERGAHRWWLTPEELDHYGIRGQPERYADYLAFAAWDKVVRRALSDTQSAALLDNKWLFVNYFEGLGFPVPKTYGLLHPVQGILQDRMRLRSVDDLVSWCRRTGIADFVLKPVAGYDSKGVVVIVDTGWQGGEPLFETSDGRFLTVAELESQLTITFRNVTGCILQERCVPHPWFQEASLGPSNTVRMVTFVPNSGEPELQAAVLYAGREGQMVNTWQGGAISIAIDSSTGQLGRGRMLPRYSTEWLTQHPDTGGEFYGHVLPNWEEAHGLCLEAARMTPNLRLICWEILLTDRGPRLLEGNLGFGLTMFQVHTEGFLRNGMAEQWRQAGADLPDGSRKWDRRTLATKIRDRIPRPMKSLVRPLIGNVGRLRGPLARHAPLEHQPLSGRGRIRRGRRLDRGGGR